MPATIRILAALAPERRAQVEKVLANLHDAGYSVTILPDAEPGAPETGLGYRVEVDRPGYHATARLRPEASAEEWTASLQALGRGQQP